MKSELKVLILDIENFPMEVYAWALGDQHISVDFVKRDWNICAWSAKWYGAPANEIIYMDNRDQRNIYDDKRLVKGIAKLINEADVVVGQNVARFDIRKINARAIINRLPPIKPTKITDILTEKRRVFAFTSHKLGYTTEQINTKYKKLKHEKYPGFDLWKACLAHKQDAWKEMEIYCKHDVLSTEEQYHNLRGWIRTPNVGPLDGKDRCKCGSMNLRRKGYAHTDAGKYQIYLCLECGKWPRGATNLLTKAERSVRLREAK